MRRTQISLSADERRLLDAEAARTGRSMSALIREAVSKTYAHRSDTDTDLQAIDAALGAWKDRELNGKEYVERLRSGSRLADAAAP